MLVWGGDNGSPLGTGGSYDPAGDAWSALSAAGAPAPRFVTSAVWTGTEMIVWGGSSAAYLDTGGRYRPDLDSWRATTPAAAPRPRAFHSGTWTGSSMLVWGGVANGGTWNDGARFCACLTWYTDGDGDGYGGGPACRCVMEATRRARSAPEGTATTPIQP
jgi:hypothetical protein